MGNDRALSPAQDSLEPDPDEEVAPHLGFVEDAELERSVNAAVQDEDRDDREDEED
jgi:hypothetical protein